MHRTELSEFRRHCARPERICWLVAAHGEQRTICPLGWKMNCSGTPPMLAIAVAPGRFAHELVVAAKEFVLAWPGEGLAAATLRCGTSSGRAVDKFKDCGLTPLPAAVVKAPLVAECIANLECRLAGQMTAGDHTIFVGEVVAVWVHDHPGRLLCSVDEASGYDPLVARGGYRFGVVKA